MQKRVMAVICVIALLLSLAPATVGATETETFIVGETKENVTIEQKGGYRIRLSHKNQVCILLSGMLIP